MDDRVFSEKSRLNDTLDDVRQAIIDSHQDELNSLRQEYDAIRADFRQRMNGYGRRLQTLWRAISDELEDAMPDIDDYPVPEANEADERSSALYDSGRDYLNQIEHYRRYQGKEVVTPTTEV